MRSIKKKTKKQQLKPSNSGLLLSAASTGGHPSQTEEDMAVSGPQHSGGGGGDNIQVELRHELRVGLRDLKTEIKLVLAEVRGDPPASEQMGSAAPNTQRTERQTGKKRTDNLNLKVLNLDADVLRLVPKEASSATSAVVPPAAAVSELEAENRALRALVAEQQSHIDKLKELVLGTAGRSYGRPPEPPE